ncbi:MAG: Nif3-like dinuclear metal center hexameric protein [Armatimonadota bacterium]|nr:Nif3-like dinuclear metal center hexameric protein [Armatimonadota bacterium]
MKAIDLKNHIVKVGTWVNWENTVDRFIMGDPETEVKGIAVAWQSRTAALKKAVELGCNLFVTHESTFYRHWDNDKHILSLPHVVEKRKFIEDHGLVILRIHDMWDQMPKVGIVDSWAAHLGLANKLKSDTFHAVYTSPKSTLIELAKHVAAATSYLGQECVEMIGDPKAKVSKVGIGCGAITNHETMVSLGADALITADDGTEYVGHVAWEMDRGIPMIIVNHPTAEEPGVKNLADYISKHFPEVKTHFIPQGCMYRLVP